MQAFRATDVYIWKHRRRAQDLQRRFSAFPQPQHCLKFDDRERPPSQEGKCECNKEAVALVLHLIFVSVLHQGKLLDSKLAASKVLWVQSVVACPPVLRAVPSTTRGYSMHLIRVLYGKAEHSPKADTSESALMMIALSFIIARLKACRTSPSAALGIGVCRHCSRTTALTKTMEVGMRYTVLRWETIPEMHRCITYLKKNRSQGLKLVNVPKYRM